MKSVLAVGGVMAAGLYAVGPRRANAYYQGPPSDHFDGLQFFNPGREEPKGLQAFLRWHFMEKSEAWPASFRSQFRDRPPPTVDTGARVAFVGHATFLLQTSGHNILIDPVWAERASPVSFAGPKRVNAPGIAFDDLPKIDTVLVTHNHYDHMDIGTIGRLWQRDRPRFITPLGNDTILRNGVPGINVSAYDWDTSVVLSERMRIHVEPTQHWSARGTGDRRHALWASFVVEAPAGKIYCVGDSGFGDGRTFARVGQRHPGLALALLPIGGYEPRWFMRQQHMNPHEAVQALTLSGAARAVGHHWGTFCLTNEAIETPRTDLAIALSSQGVAPDRFRALLPGEVVPHA